MVATAEDAKIAMIREQMPAVTQYAYLNTGTYGPLPQASVDAMTEYLRLELERGRLAPEVGSARSREIRAEARAEIARFLGCQPADVSLTRHTTDGMNIAVLGLNWRPGDEIVVSDMEHPGGQGPVYNVARRYGVTVRTARLGDGSGDVVGVYERLVTPRTRMLIVSHLTWNTGAVLPLKELVDLAHRHHVLVVADAAQSAGAIPVDVVDLGVDVYAASGQKWLCGPEGTGSTYVSPTALEQIQPTFVGYRGVDTWEHYGAYFMPKPGAERFEIGGTNTPAILGQATSVRWIRETVGVDWAFERIARLGRYAWEKLAELDGVTLITPKAKMAGLVSFTVAGIEPPDLVRRLTERGVVIRYIRQPLCTRIATGFYNTEEDVDRAVAAIREVQSSL